MPSVVPGFPLPRLAETFFPTFFPLALSCFHPLQLAEPLWPCAVCNLFYTLLGLKGRNASRCCYRCWFSVNPSFWGSAEGSHFPREHGVCRGALPALGEQSGSTGVLPSLLAVESSASSCSCHAVGPKGFVFFPARSPETETVHS